MLKKTIILLSILCSINFYSQNFSGKATYYKNIYVPKATKKNDTKHNRFLNMIRGVKNVKFELNFSKIEAIFKLNEKLNLDENDENIKFIAKISGGDGKYYTNIKTKELLQQVEFTGENYIISKNIDSIKWEFTNEKKKFGKYLCYKATTIKINKGYKTYYKKVEAWYCPDLPYRFGPIDYAGLPGLIFEVKIEKEASFTLKNIELNGEKIKIKKPKKGKIVTPDEYNEICKKAYLNLKNGM